MRMIIPIFPSEQLSCVFDELFVWELLLRKSFEVKKTKWNETQIISVDFFRVIRSGYIFFLMNRTDVTDRILNPSQISKADLQFRLYSNKSHWRAKVKKVTFFSESHKLDFWTPFRHHAQHASTFQRSAYCGSSANNLSSLLVDISYIYIYSRTPTNNHIHHLSCHCVV